MSAPIPLAAAAKSNAERPSEADNSESTVIDDKATRKKIGTAMG
ncbi:MAG: hypothetical protein RKE49_10280 [Oceanicaulis sp.]